MWADSHYRWSSLRPAILCCGIAFQALISAEALGGEYDFAHRVVPILRKNCVECHGGRRDEGDFSLNTRESLLEGWAISPGHAADSQLIDHVSSYDKDERMPKNKAPLSADDIKTLREWVDAGAP